jgi:hypothetical protein
MNHIRKCLEYARRAKSEGNVGLHRFYIRKARAYVSFYRITPQ